MLRKVAYDEEEIWYINTPEGREDNNGYSAPFPVWWRMFDLNGAGFLIGEDKLQAKWINKKLRDEFPDIATGFAISLDNAHFNIDVTRVPLPFKVEWIFCMAVLEHTYDPLAAVRNMADALNPNGLLCLSVPRNGFKQHRRPIDCYRFLEDAMEAFAHVGNLKLLDYAQDLEWCAIYRKEIT
jgi:SAM-dependent methyltransferase